MFPFAKANFVLANFTKKKIGIGSDCLRVIVMDLDARAEDKFAAISEPKTGEKIQIS